MDFSTINFLAVFVAAVVSFILGFLWHGPLFGKQWFKLIGVSHAEVAAMQAKGMGPMVPSMIAAFLQQFVVAFVVAYLAGGLAIVGAVPAIMFAVLLWLGFIVTALLNSVLWEKRKFNLYLFNIAYHLTSLIAISLIVVLWR